MDHRSKCKSSQREAQEKNLCKTVIQINKQTKNYKRIKQTIKIQSFCFSNGIIQKMKRQASPKEKILTCFHKKKYFTYFQLTKSCYSDHVKKTKTKLLQLNNKKINYTILKTSKRWEQGLYKRSYIDKRPVITPKDAKDYQISRNAN